MEACNGFAVTYVPLDDTLGPYAVEFIINHAEVSIAFLQENKIPSVCASSFFELNVLFSLLKYELSSTFNCSTV
ncbi:unnamed protein product [Trifolium pratense]|uniref:Uncharacterized protein n=2 Tax=Trifolium pratense TaxID=57577 RepID=A0ACB0LJB2_TRIPR|nr:unnamed protein product [Trifolium pratense]CAJ2672477.1 unnamed protein product [Trifolium pratense]